MSALSSVPSDSGEFVALQSPQRNSVASAVPCIYCRGDIAARDFQFWSAARRLVSATCPHCERRVTLAAATWRRWVRKT